MASIAQLFPITDAEKQGIIQEFGKTKQDINEDLKILREWLKKQPQIPEITDDTLLEHILVRNKFRIEKTKLKIDSYFTSKHAYADYFDTLDPSTDAMVESTNKTFSVYMPKLTPEYNRVHIWRMNLDCKPQDIDYKSIVRYSSILNETQMLFDYCPSVVTILDAKGVKMAHAHSMDLTIQAKTYKIFYEAFSGRIKQMHIINVSPAAEYCVNLMKLSLPEKLRNRMYFHSKLETLHKQIPKDCLPLELGGTDKSIAEISENIASTFRHEREYILKRNKTSTNEALRIGDPPIETNLFGVEGTFKKITLD